MTLIQRIKMPLLLRVVVAISLGVMLGRLMPEWGVAVFTTFNAVFSSFLKFLIPLIIVGLVMPSISDIGRSAGRLLLLTVCIAYGSTILSGLFSYGVSASVFPHLLPSTGVLQTVDSNTTSIAPYFTLAIPPLLDVMSALVLAFTAGLGMAYLNLPRMKDLADEMKVLIEKTIAVVVIPLLPLYIFGIFLEMTRTGQAWHILMTFASIIGVIFGMHIVLLLIQYCIAGVVVRRNPFRLLATMMPAYFTALGTSSSAATIPVTVRQAQRMNVSKEVTDFAIPLCATIHMSGSCMKITACAVALMLMQGLTFTTPMFVGFVMMLGVMMVASPGVPGGAIMASLGVLSSLLGFGEQDCALMIALYIAMDSFGTACNVTGDGAISLIVDRVHHARMSSQNQGQNKLKSGFCLVVPFLFAFCTLSTPLQAKAKTRNSSQRQGWELVWNDEFNGRSLSDVWTRIPRFHHPSEWNKYMSTDDRLFRVRRGRLILYGRTNDYLPQDTASFLTGGVYTRGKILFQRGRIDIRLRMDDASGAWPAAWLLPEGRWPHDGEIDIMERLNYDSIAHQTVHSYTTEYDTIGRKTQPWHITAPIRKGKWNVYSVELYPDSMSFFINGQHTFTYCRQSELGPEQYPYDRPMYLLLDMQLGAYWLGRVNPKELPYRYQIDYVRFYKKRIGGDQRD